MRKYPLVLLLICLATFGLQISANPGPTVVITTPQNGSYVHPDLELRWSVTGEVNRTEILVDDTVVETDLEPSRESYYLLGLSNGSRRIRVRAVGVNNEIVEDMVIVTVVTAPVNVALLFPKADLISNSSFINVTWNATGPIKLIRFRSTESLDEVTLHRDQRSYNLTLKTEGEIRVTVAVVDLRGPTITRKVTFIHDSSPPLIDIESPKPMETYHRTVLLAEWRCSDPVSEVTAVQVYLNDILLSEEVEGQFLLNDLADGEQVLTVIAYDAAGNKGQNSLRFIVSVPFLARYGLIVSLFIVIGIGLLIPLYVMRGKR